MTAVAINMGLDASLIENPTLRRIFQREKEHVAAHARGKTKPVAMYGDTFYGDTFYGDTFYGDTFYGDYGMNLSKSRREHHESGGNGSDCFVGSTEILTPTGPQRIDALKRGDMVLSWNAGAQSFVARKIQKVYVHEPRPVVEFTYAGRKEPVVLTALHTLLTQDGWKEVKHISPDDQLIVALNGVVGPAKIEAINVSGRREPVYNLRTAGEHTFIADGLLAHNFTRFRQARTLAYQMAEKAATSLTPQRKGTLNPALG